MVERMLDRVSSGWKDARQNEVKWKGCLDRMRYGWKNLGQNEVKLMGWMVWNRYGWKTVWMECQIDMLSGQNVLKLTVRYTTILF